MSRHAEARAFLAEYVPADVAALALERIAAHDETLDESYRWASVSKLVYELAEEPLDTIAWSSLLSCRVEDPRGRALLAAISQRAAEAHHLVSELGRLLRNVSGANVTPGTAA